MLHLLRQAGLRRVAERRDGELALSVSEAHRVAGTKAFGRAPKESRPRSGGARQSHNFLLIKMSDERFRPCLNK